MEQNQQQNIMVVRLPKSMGVAVVLTVLFGPLGMFYSTIIGALIMLFFGGFLIIVTFGIGLLITWPISLIWTILAVQSHNSKLYSGPANPSRPTVEPNESIPQNRPEVFQSKSINTDLYREVEQKSDEEIDLILAGSVSMLNTSYIEVLKDVQINRIQIKKRNQERGAFYNMAVEQSSKQVDQLLSNPSLLNPLYIITLRYVKRCNDLFSHPTYEGFLQTFNPNYVAPETPAEKEEKNKIEEDRINQEKEQKDKTKAALKTVKQITGVMALLLIVVFFAIKSHGNCNTKIEIADRAFPSNNNNNQVLSLYNDALSSLPLFGNSRQKKHIKERIKIVKERISEKSDTTKIIDKK